MDYFHQRNELKFAGDGAPDGTFSGYGAVFGNIDLGGDMIVKGAFSNTLKEAKSSGRSVKMLLQHGGMGVVAEDDIPIGVWNSIEEDDKGLKVEGRLFALDTQKGKYIHEGLKSGVLDGLSIGFRARDVVMGTKAGEPRRTLKSVDLREISIVLDPMNQKARVDEAKAASRVTSIREFEAFLRDEGGFSHQAAKALASGGYKAANLRDEGEREELTALTERFRRLRA